MPNITITSLKIKKANRKRCKCVAIIIILAVIIASSCISVFAKTNSFGVEFTSVDMSYYQESQYYTNSWSVARQNARISAYNVVNKFNGYIYDTDNTHNVVYWMDKIYESEAQTAADFGNRWNSLRYKLINLTNSAQEICGYSKQPDKVNGIEINLIDYDSITRTANDLQSELDKLATEIYDTYNAANYTASKTLQNDFQGLFTLFDSMWNSLGIVIKTLGTGQSDMSNMFGVSWTTTEIEAFANSVSGIVKTFAYALVCVLFGVNLTSTALQYELLTLRGGVRVFARVLLAKFWVDLSINICILALNIINSLASALLGNLTSTEVLFGTFGDYISPADSGNPVSNFLLNGLGSVINLLSGVIAGLPLTILLIVVGFCLCSVFIKIIARCFELTCLVTVSPIFFGTLVGENTKRYFQKFFNAFLSTAMYIVWIGIVYAIATLWIADITTNNPSNVGDYFNVLITILPKCLVLIAITMIMKKPPKVLTSLIE